MVIHHINYCHVPLKRCLNTCLNLEKYSRCFHIDLSFRSDRITGTLKETLFETSMAYTHYLQYVSHVYI